MIPAAAVGFVLGWVGSMPLAGAVSIFVFQRGLAGRIWRGLSLSCGAAVAESVWCLVALIGADQLLQRWPQAEQVARIVGGTILIGLGVYFLLKRRVLAAAGGQSPTATGDSPVGANAAQAALPPVPAASTLVREFWLGFSLVAGNISVPFNWLAMLTVLVSLGYDLAAVSYALFVLGVALGIISWFALLLRILVCLRTRFRPSVLALFMRLMGALLVIVGVVAMFRGT